MLKRCLVKSVTPLVIEIISNVKDFRWVPAGPEEEMVDETMGLGKKRPFNRTAK
jgi:hypothetical protein